MNQSASQYTRIIAKRAEDSEERAIYQSLQGHIGDCLEILKHQLTLYRGSFETLCKSNRISFDDFARSAFVTVFLHDIGKATVQFQGNICRGKHSSRYPHAFFAVPILFRFFRENPALSLMRDIANGIVPLEILSILGHHTQLYDGMYDSTSTEPTFLHVAINEFVDDLENMYKNLHFENVFGWNRIKLAKLDLIPAPLIYSNSSDPLYKQINAFIERSKTACVEVDNDPERRRLKVIYALNNSLLRTCDNLSSSYFDQLAKTGRLVPSDSPYGSVPFDFPFNTWFHEISLNETTTVPKQGWRDFQLDLLRSVDKYVILRAPCGRGKTLPAFLWAKNVCDYHSKDKIIFAMPTQVTSNAMWDTLKQYCSADEIVGLFHGKSLVSLKVERELSQRIEEQEDALGRDQLEEIRTVTYESGNFHKPVVVTTVDHLLYSAIHGFRRSDYAFGNALRSVVIFDEAHYYDFTAMKSLMTLLRLFRRLGIPHIVMSGTLPAFFSKRLNENGDYGLIEDTSGSLLTPFELIRRESVLIERDSVNEFALNEIVRNFKGNNASGTRLRQTVILNTVSRAQAFYLAIRKKLELEGIPNLEDCLVLYHSQFTFRDRSAIERGIFTSKNVKPFILVGTQVIEVSLDISCDVMYSEMAPVDAIAQRAGRLNRGGQRPTSNGIRHQLILYRPESNAPYFADGMDVIMSRSSDLLQEGVYSYRKLAELCDVLYNGRDLIYSAQFDEIFSKGILFGPPYWGIADTDEIGKPGYSFREEEVQTLLVVPDTVYSNQLTNLSPENEVRVPAWKINKLGDAVVPLPKGNRYYLVCRSPSYHSKLGFTDFDLPNSERMGSGII